VSRLWRWMGGRGTASAVLSLQVTFQGGSAMFETERAAREGSAGGSLQGLTIAVPGNAPLGNHYFYFRQTDQYGRVVGFSTAALYAALAGYTPHAVDMPAGVNDMDAVADMFRSVAATVFAAAVRVDNVVTIADPNIDAAGAFLPSSGGGGGGMLGTQDVSSSNLFTQPDSNVCSLVTPAFADDTYLFAVQVDIGSAYVDPLRFGLYVGGGVNAPGGTPLLWDSGVWPAAVVTGQYLTLFPSSLVQVPASTRLQAIIVGAAGTTTEVGYQGASGAGDWETSPGGIFNVNAAIPPNPAAALPGTFPAGGSLTSATFTFNVRLIYSTLPLRGDGALQTQYGVHVAASDLAFTTAFAANVLQGGALPPQLEGLGLDFVEIAANDDASFRLAAYQGGALLNPNTADLVYDVGQGPAGPGLPIGWYRRNVPAAVHAPIDRTRLIWSAARDNGGATVRFSNVPGPGPAGPDTNPMDYPDNTPGNEPEYESFSSNPGFAIDPTTPFEASFPANTTNAPIDTLPGNVQGSKLGFRIRPVELAAI